MKGFVDDFKAFAMKGNVVDLAVAVVIGAAFGKIVSALVDNIITPLVGMILGGVDFSGLSFAFKDSVFTYGAFIQATIDFLIVALVLFFVVRAIAKLDKKEEPAADEPKAPTQEELLTEIRDLMAKK